MKVLFTAHLSRPFLVISNELFNERRNLWRERERENENGSIHLHDFFHLLSEQGGTRISVIHAIGLRILSFSLRISFEDLSSLLEIFNHGSLDSYSGRFFFFRNFVRATIVCLSACFPSGEIYVHSLTKSSIVCRYTCPAGNSRNSAKFPARSTLRRVRKARLSDITISKRLIAFCSSYICRTDSEKPIRKAGFEERLIFF